MLIIQNFNQIQPGQKKKMGIIGKKLHCNLHSILLLKSRYYTSHLIPHGD